MPRNELHGLALATLSLQHDVYYIIIIYIILYIIKYIAVCIHSCMLVLSEVSVAICMYYIYIYVACFSVKN